MSFKKVAHAMKSQKSRWCFFDGKGELLWYLKRTWNWGGLLKRKHQDLDKSRVKFMCIA